jgi:cell division protein FtsB
MSHVIPILLILFAILIGGSTFFAAGGYPRLQAWRQNLERQTQFNYSLAQKVNRLKSEVDGLQHDDRAIEKAARSELGMARPDELIFLFDEKKSDE